MTYQVRIFDKTFQASDFAGTAWQTNLPLLFEKLVDQTPARDGQTNRYFGTSTTSLTISPGSKVFTTQTNLKLDGSGGLSAFAVNTANVSQWMAGTVTAYNASTGSLTLNVSSTSGAGTIATWAIVFIPGVGSRLAASADYGGIGALSTDGSVMDFERYAIGLPRARRGLYLHTDFLEHADFARDDTSGDWTLVTNEPVNRLAYAHNSNEFNSTTGPNHGDGVQGIWSVQSAVAGRKSSLVFGDRGFISAFEPGNFYLTAALKFSQSFSSSDLYTCRFGLRATRSSKLGNIFAAGGIGFEIEEIASGKAWSVVINNGSKTIRKSLGVLSPLTTWAVCHIFGNMHNREIHMRVALSSATDANEFLPFPAQYQVTEDLSDWPSDLSMLMNPVLSIEKLNGTGTRAVFIDRMLLNKALSR